MPTPSRKVKSRSSLKQCGHQAAVPVPWLAAFPSRPPASGHVCHLSVPPSVCSPFVGCLHSSESRLWHRLQIPVGVDYEDRRLRHPYRYCPGETDDQGSLLAREVAIVWEL